MRYYVTTGTSLSEDSRCWFTQDEIDAAKETKSSPRRSDEYDDYSSLWEILDAGVLPKHKAIEFLASERSRGLRFKTDSRSGLGLDESKANDAYEIDARQVVNEWFDINCWKIGVRHLLSAELSTLLTMSETIGFSDRDKVHFIGGKSNRAEVALSAAALRRIADEGYFNVRSKNIVADHNRRLDPLDHGTFLEAMVQLWDDVNPAGSDGPVQFVVTGGYKGVGIGLAIRVKAEATAFHYLHEEAKNEPRYRRGLVSMFVEDGNLVPNPPNPPDARA